MNSTDTDLPISEGGSGDRCGEINQAAINWAMQTVSQKTLERYQQYGQQMLVSLSVIVVVVVNVFPLFFYVLYKKPLFFKKKN